MKNTAILNTSNKNTNNCGKVHLKNKTKNYYCLKLCNIQTQQSNINANVNFQEREIETDRQRQRQRQRQTQTDGQRQNCTIILNE